MGLTVTTSHLSLKSSISPAVRLVSVIALVRVHQIPRKISGCPQTMEGIAHPSYLFASDNFPESRRSW